MRGNQQIRQREAVTGVRGKSGNVLFWKQGEEVFKGGRSDYLSEMLPIRSSRMKTENQPLI